MIISFGITYLIQFALPSLMNVEEYGLLKKVLLTMSYVSLTSFGSKDQWHLDFAQKNTNILKGTIFYGSLGLVLACLILAVTYFNYRFDLIVILFIVLHVIFFSLFQYAEIFIVYIDSKKKGSLFKLGREAIFLCSILLFVRMEWWLYFVGSIVSVLSVFFIYFSNYFNSNIKINTVGNWYAFPVRGIRMQLINLSNQISINGDKLLAAIYLSNSDFGIYSIIYLVPQGLLAISSQIANYELDRKDAYRGSRTMVFILLTILLIIGFSLPLVGWIYKIEINKSIALILMLGVVSNFLWVFYCQNTFRKENSWISVFTFALGLVLIGGCFFWFYRRAGIHAYVGFYVTLAFYKIIYYLIWNLARRSSF